MIEGIARALHGTGGLVYSDTDGGSVFLNRLPSTPDRAVAVYSMAGPESDSKLPYSYVDFQVVVRGDADGVWAWDTAMAVFSKLHGLRNTTLPDGTYAVFVLATQGSPFALGDDDNGRVQYSIDFRGERMHITEERP